MRSWYLLTAGVWLASIQPTLAQVAVGPGSVDAPYVHVDWWGGRIHVCAPFVNVYANWPGCWQQEAPGGDPQGSNVDQPRNGSQTGYDHRGQLAESSRWLYDSLGRFRTAELWREYLAVAPGEPLSAEQLRQSNPAGTANLRTVLEHFDAAAGEEQYRMISSLSAFQQTRGLLAGYLTELENSQSVAVSPSVATDSPRAATPRWSPASRQPGVGLPGLARDIARPSAEELPTPPRPHAD